MHGERPPAPRGRSPHFRTFAGTSDEDDLRAGVAREHIFSEQHQQSIWPNNIAFGSHYHQAITVTIEGNAEIVYLARRYFAETDWADRLQLASLGWRTRRLGRQGLEDLLRFVPMPVAEEMPAALAAK